MDKERLIQKSIHHLLSKEEESEFKKYYQSDEKFRSDVELAKDLQESIRSIENDKLRKEFNTLDQKDTKNYPAKRVNWKLFSFIVIILGVLTFIFYYFFLKDPSPKAIYAAYYETPANTYFPITRDLNVSSPKTQAFLSFEQGNYEKAASQLRSLSEYDSIPQLQFFYAISLAESDNIEEAINILTNIETKEEFLKEEVAWYLGLYFLAQEEKDNAIIALNEVQKTSLPNRVELLKRLEIK